MSAAHELVEAFWANLYRRDFQAVGNYFAPDGEYTDMPTPRRRRRAWPAQIAARLELGLGPLASISHDVRGITARGRHGRHRTRRALGVANGRTRQPSLRVDDASARRKLVRWWDYWDLGTLMGAAPAWWVEHIMEESAKLGLR